MHLINNFVPDNFFYTLLSDTATVYTYYFKSVETEVSEQENLNHEDEQKALQEKVYCAGYRILATLTMGAGALMAYKLILPIFTFKFCVAAAIAVGTYVAGHDIFVMLRKREVLVQASKDNVGNAKSLPAPGSEQYVKAFTEGTFLGPLWRLIATKA